MKNNTQMRLYTTEKGFFRAKETDNSAKLSFVLFKIFL